MKRKTETTKETDMDAKEKVKLLLVAYELLGISRVASEGVAIKEIADKVVNIATLADAEPECGEKV